MKSCRKVEVDEKYEMALTGLRKGCLLLIHVSSKKNKRHESRINNSRGNVQFYLGAPKYDISICWMLR